MSADDTVTMADIARLAEVRRPTVSNWRRRHADFPQQVDGSATQPVFSSDEVAQWLDTRHFPDSEQHPTYGAAFRANRRMSVGLAVPQVELLAALIALRKGAGQVPSEPTEILRLAEDLERRSPSLEGMFVPVLASGLPAMIEAAAQFVQTSIDDAGALIERVLSLDEHRAQSGYATTPKIVNEFVAGLVGQLGDSTLCDPAAGAGGLLMAVARTSTGQTYAVDSDQELIRLLRQRALCLDINVTVSTEHIDLATYTAGPFDVVVVDPPFIAGEHAARGEQIVRGERVPRPPGPVDWLVLAHRLAGADGRAYVVTPAWTLTKPTEERHWLAESGSLRGIFQLPRRVHGFRTGTEFVVLKLGPPSATSKVVLCDADKLARRHGDDWPRIAAELVRSGNHANDEVSAALDPSALAGRDSWLPAHVLAPVVNPVDHNARVNDAYHRWQGVSTEDFRELALLEGGGMGSGTRSFMEVAIVRPGHRIAEGDLVADATEPARTVVGAPELRGVSRIGDRLVLASVLQERYKAEVTHPGDIVVLTEAGVRTWIDHAGGAIVQFPAQIVRPHKIGQWQEVPSRVLARMLETRRNAVRETGSTVRRVSLPAMSVPDLTPGQWNRLDTVCAEIDERRADLRAKLTALDELDTAIAASVADGVLPAVRVD